MLCIEQRDLPRFNALFIFKIVNNVYILIAKLFSSVQAYTQTDIKYFLFNQMFNIVLRIAMNLIVIATIRKIDADDQCDLH